MIKLIKSIQKDADSGQILEALETFSTLLYKLEKFTTDGFYFYLGAPENDCTSYELEMINGSFVISDISGHMNPHELRSTDLFMKCIVPQLKDIVGMILSQMDERIANEQKTLKHLEILKRELMDVME